MSFYVALNVCGESHARNANLLTIFFIYVIVYRIYSRKLSRDPIFMVFAVDWQTMHRDIQYSILSNIIYTLGDMYQFKLLHIAIYSEHKIFVYIHSVCSGPGLRSRFPEISKRR